jgi:urease beta subunit
VIPGELAVADGAIELAPGRERRTLEVMNTGDRPIQVGSHFHFADVNAALRFDRAAADGFRLDVPAGTSLRFEPGLGRAVPLVALAGLRSVPGLQLR